MTTPLYDELVKTTPYPTPSVDTSFRWETPRTPVAPPRPGVRPVNKRKKKR